MFTFLVALLILVAGLALGSIAGAVVWERYRTQVLGPSTDGAAKDRVALVEELTRSRDRANARADAAERRMRDVEQMLLERRAFDAGVTPLPPPDGPPQEPLPLELAREIGGIEDAEARIELEAEARELLAAGKKASEVAAELFA